MSFNWFDLIVTFGILQGVVCAALLLRQRPVQTSRKLLVALLLVFSLLSVKIELHTLGLWDTAIFRYFPLGIDLLIQPLLYLYIASLTRPGFRLTVKLWPHFLLPGLFLIHAIIVYILVLPQPVFALKDQLAEQWHYNAIKTFEDFLSVTSAVFYGYLCGQNINHYRKWLYQHISDTNYLTFSWLKNLALATGILGIGLLVNILLDHVWNFEHRFFHWQLFYIYLSVIIYYLGLKGYLASKQAADLTREMIFDSGPSSFSVKYSAEELASAKAAILQSLVQQRIFLDNGLTLNKLAADAGLSPALVSVTINQELGKSFRTLINDLRVEDVKLKLVDPVYAHLSILGIALESGFNSEASFYRIFKSTTGLSPKEYIAKAKLPG